MWHAARLQQREEEDMEVAGIAKTEFRQYVLDYGVERVSLSPKPSEATLKRTMADTAKVEDFVGTVA